MAPATAARMRTRISHARSLSSSRSVRNMRLLHRKSYAARACHDARPMPAEPIPFLDASAIRAAVAMPELLDAVEAAFRDVAEGRDRSPLRTQVELPDGRGTMLLMPGLRTGGS